MTAAALSLDTQPAPARATGGRPVTGHRARTAADRLAARLRRPAPAPPPYEPQLATAADLIVERVLTEMRDRGYIRVRRLRLADRWQPLPWLVSRVAAGLLVAYGIALAVWGWT